ncbi:MAG: glucodextranase DOMON-like domain-containing protein [Elusimicrobiota bacterium]
MAIVLVLLATFAYPMGKGPSIHPPLPTAPEMPGVQSFLSQKISFSALLIYQPEPQTSPEEVLVFLKKYPQYRIIFCPSKDFLGKVTDPALIEEFRQLLKEGKIDPVLALPGKPLLPLIYNLNLAKPFLPQGSFLPGREFAWPEDIRNQLAEAKANYRNLWGKTAQGLIFPNGMISPEIVPLIRRMDFQWGIGASLANPDQLTTNFILDDNFSFLAVTPNFYGKFDHPFIEQLAQQAKNAPNFERPSPLTINLFFQDPSLLEQLDKQYNIYSFTPAQLIANYPANFFKIEKENFTPVDWNGKNLSHWVSQPLQNRAWELIAETREAVKKYKNSGEAEIDRLDNALQEIYTLESSQWFEETNLSDQEKELFFRSGLANIYRLINQPLPSELNLPLKEQISLPNPETKITVGTNGFQATDRTNDDYGDGKYLYPQDPTLLPGYFDLKSFQLNFDDKEITFKVEFSSATDHNRILVDIYIDLNHTFGAGSTKLLAQRNAETKPLDAWEYCLSLTNEKTTLFQYRSSQKEPSNIAVFYSYSDSLSPQFISVAIPRDTLRGNPLTWGYIVCALGALHSGGEPQIIGVKEQPAPDSFSGGLSGQPNPPLIDLILPPGYSQEIILSAFRNKGVIEIPALRVK